MSSLFADLERGAAVAINRPGRADHCCQGRFVELGQDESFAWVAFHKDNASTLPALDTIGNPSKVIRKLYPLSQLLAL